jgi:hypothetical protein
MVYNRFADYRFAKLAHCQIAQKTLPKAIDKLETFKLNPQERAMSPRNVPARIDLTGAYSGLSKKACAAAIEGNFTKTMRAGFL